MFPVLHNIQFSCVYLRRSCVRGQSAIVGKGGKVHIAEVTRSGEKWSAGVTGFGGRAQYFI